MASSSSSAETTVLVWTVLFCCLVQSSLSSASLYDLNSPGTPAPALKLRLKRLPTTAAAAGRTRREALDHSADRDLLRIHALFRKRENAFSRLAGAGRRRVVAESRQMAAADAPEVGGRFVAKVESGVTLGSGEYFIDVFIGTPPRRFSLILDTGSDLNWIQCRPCYDCFEQRGSVYDPAASSSYRNVSCTDRRCGLIASPDPPSRPCNSTGTKDDGNGGGGRSCSYFYWYGDQSNTTGDLALETFTMNLTGGGLRRVEDVVFGCGHWNRGLFHGAAGLLGLGRGPLSFASQLRPLYGHAFSYCLVDRNSDLSVSSKLIFGGGDVITPGGRELNYTTFVSGKENSVDTFYYVQIKSIIVGREKLRIPPETWDVAEDGSGGTIVDSGTTLSYFTVAAFEKIKEAFVEKVKRYPAAEGFPVLSPCYNVSGEAELELPEFAIEFGDGAVWSFPAANYFIRLETEQIACLAMLPTPNSALSILGNYQQQNFYVSYDLTNSRLGFAPARCEEL